MNFTYNRTFRAISAALSLPKGTTVGISMRKFVAAFNDQSETEPSGETTYLPLKGVSETRSAKFEELFPWNQGKKPRVVARPSETRDTD